MHENLFNTVPGVYGLYSRNCKCYEGVALPFNVCSCEKYITVFMKESFIYDICFDVINI